MGLTFVEGQRKSMINCSIGFGQVLCAATGERCRQSPVLMMIVVDTDLEKRKALAEAISQ